MPCSAALSPTPSLLGRSLADLRLNAIGSFEGLWRWVAAHGADDAGLSCGWFLFFLGEVGVQ